MSIRLSPLHFSFGLRAPEAQGPLSVSFLTTPLPMRGTFLGRAPCQIEREETSHENQNQREAGMRRGRASVPGACRNCHHRNAVGRPGTLEPLLPAESRHGSTMADDLGTD